MPAAVTDVYRVYFRDLETKGFLLLRHKKSSPVEFGCQEDFLVDNARVLVNKKYEIVVMSTSVTVL